MVSFARKNIMVVKDRTSGLFWVKLTKDQTTDSAVKAIIEKDRNNPSLWPVDEAYGHKFAGRDTCTLMAATCRRLNETKELRQQGTSGAARGPSCMF